MVVDDHNMEVISCQFCETIVNDIDMLQLHLISCPVIDGNDNSVQLQCKDSSSAEADVKKILTIIDDGAEITIESVSLEDVKHSEVANNTTINNTTINTIEQYAEAILEDDDEGSDEKTENKLNESEVDVLELMKTYEIMYNEKFDAEKNLSETLKVVEEMELELTKYKERVRIVLEDNEYLRDENNKLKNERKLMAHSSSSNSSSSSHSESDLCEGPEHEFCVQTNKELGSLRDEVAQFSKFVYDELTLIKETVGIQQKSLDKDTVTQVMTEVTQVADDSSRVNSDDGNWKKVTYGGKKMSITNEKKKKPLMSLTNRFTVLENQSEMEAPAIVYSTAPSTSNRPIPRPRPNKQTKLPSNCSNIGEPTIPQSHNWEPAIVPGVKDYNKAHITTTFLISDSTIGKLSVKNIRENIDSNEEDVIVNKHPGATAEEIAHYSTLPLSRIRPQQVVIVAGTNDIGRGFQRGGTPNEYEIVNNILQIGKNAEVCGAKKIFISSVLVRWGFQYQRVVIRVNTLLESMCREHGFIFIDNWEITRQHIGNDGLHPNKHGHILLKMNLLRCFHSFNPFFCDFSQNSYDEAWNASS